MGLFRLFSSCEISSPKVVEPVQPIQNRPKWPNPNPANFVIEKIRSIGKFTIVKVYYPDCTNYEGRKILVYKNIGQEKIRQLKLLDPHFCQENSHLSPIARFEPTNCGWRFAISFCKSIKK